MNDADDSHAAKSKSCVSQLLHGKFFAIVNRR